MNKKFDLKNFLDDFNQVPKLLLAASVKKAAIKEMAGSDTDKVRRFILEEFSHGEPPAFNRIKSSMNLNEAKLEDILSTLETRDLIVRDGSEIIGAYPFSGRESEHYIALADNRRARCLCALDALGVPFMFNQDGSVDSVCFHCRRPVKIEIIEGKAAYHEPEKLIVFLPDVDICGCSTAEAVCPSINFFCSKEHFKDWQRESKLNGYDLSLHQALPVADFIFGDYLMD